MACNRPLGRANARLGIGAGQEWPSETRAARLRVAGHSTGWLMVLLKNQLFGVDHPRCLHGKYGNDEVAGAMYPGALFSAQAAIGGNELRTDFVGDGNKQRTRLELFKTNTPMPTRDADADVGLAAFTGPGAEFADFDGLFLILEEAPFVNGVHALFELYRPAIARGADDEVGGVTATVDVDSTIGGKAGSLIGDQLLGVVLHIYEKNAKGTAALGGESYA